MPSLPEATTLRELGLPFTEPELTLIRTAMALHKASRQPQLTWDGWKQIGLALNIGTVRANQHARGVVTPRGPYGRAIGQFLNATGFAFINKGVRWALGECIDHLEEVDPWRDSLESSDRGHLNNPIDVWDRFREDQRNPRASARSSMLPGSAEAWLRCWNQVLALQELLDDVNLKRDELEADMVEVLDTVTPDAIERLPDDVLRRIFAKLPEAIQDSLRARLGLS